jgi:hypothetical protein
VKRTTPATTNVVISQEEARTEAEGVREAAERGRRHAEVREQREIVEEMRAAVNLRR